MPRSLVEGDKNIGGRTAMTGDGSQTEVTWDDSNIDSVYANVASVIGTREEITLLFGERQPGNPGQKGVMAQLKERVVLSPLVAKRFAILLDNRIRDYESKYGPTDEKAAPRERPEAPPPLRLPSFRSAEAARKAGLLFKRIRNLNVPVAFERSFKVLEKTLLGSRFLLGIKKNEIRRNPDEKILDICVRIDMPENFLAGFQENLSEVNIVFFGFEESGGTCVYKAYLDFYDKIEEDAKIRPPSSGPFLLGLGCKWDAFDNTRHALARYTWYPSLTIDAILDKLSAIYGAHKYRNAFEIAEGIIRTASKGIAHHDIVYLEVTEENKPRRSFDINMYKAELRLEEIYPFLSKMCQHYSIPSEEFHDLYDPVKAQIFGHVSGGIDREGRDFLTIYFGD